MRVGKDGAGGALGWGAPGPGRPQLDLGFWHQEPSAAQTSSRSPATPLRPRRGPPGRWSLGRLLPRTVGTAPAGSPAEGRVPAASSAQAGRQQLPRSPGRSWAPKKPSRPPGPSRPRSWRSRRPRLLRGHRLLARGPGGCGGRAPLAGLPGRSGIPGTGDSRSTFPASSVSGLPLGRREGGAGP